MMNTGMDHFFFMYLAICIYVFVKFIFKFFVHVLNLVKFLLSCRSLLVLLYILLFFFLRQYCQVVKVVFLCFLLEALSFYFFFRSMIHLELIFVLYMMRGMGIKVQVFTYGCPMYSRTFCRKHFFFHLIALFPFSDS